MHCDCSCTFRNFGCGKIRSEGIKVLVACCYIKYYAKAQWLETMSTYYHTVSVGQKFGICLAGVLAEAFSGRGIQDSGRGCSHVKDCLGQEGPLLR